MSETIVPMTIDKLEPCIELYINVFNCEPWNETWTYQTTKERLTDLLHTPKFLGFLLYENDHLIGLIAGNSKKTSKGLTFYLAELCINNIIQGKGYGKKLLLCLEGELKKRDIHSLYLLTANRGPAQAFYEKNNYVMNENRIVMKKSFE
ncbi:GNAT family N-acetyltransferase [Metabacillus sediminilitoris]|uniref:GNAT family N-acetyltransferase n=1 Tax=Metabacillus sediminilitoris TaxID=2567941 RepID=A0A4S4BNN0_9BACI|nr:GNAT family N-acetyltransferase [Metabacillus sediminilitoris]QGQ45116.1 GNAT family N-acetyltransferase [Metabacillus sediminilitoris]THF76483.1 GNAT family N-acetyltransferase [Metabacillus sediminilitoris]